ncbi:MAG: 1,4-dihydroxy-6-naphthoate synthase [Thermodesulfobacterium geofontis]|uniref:1,4-dihydroxy-6-naphtoate synthase n=1 Tax=Thermodesulfobacterium geofontis TaxID=1295609 RepID=A0A2N7PQ34_9BACT|nr:MAG: 1,4-dihydroxy-6-naphthoate synthase [Thermodesulfobacterium geofontis]
MDLGMYNQKLEIALSPCPNDVFIVSGLLLKIIETTFDFLFYFEDIETLNNLAINGSFPIIKASFAIWKFIFSEYELLPVGSALGFGVGPLLVGIEPYHIEEFSKLKIAIPGEHTTAHFLFNFFYQGKIKKIFARYDKIISLLSEKKAELGILIHEGRFLYDKYNLYKIVDLGEYWENLTSSPLPLGGFFIKRALSEKIKNEIVNLFRESINWAKNNWDKVFPLLKTYAQELEEETIKKHVNTYVNEYTYELRDPALKGLTILKDYLNIKKSLKEIIWGI